MRIVYELNDKLPPLAWTAHCNNGVIEVLHGNRVGCTASFFVDGVWNGGFKLGNFESADWFCGTGGHVYEDKVIFSTPTHVTRGLYLVKENGGLHKQ